jgi:osmotically inducible protein OsmC
MKRNATAVWNGSGKVGTGTVSTESTAVSGRQYSYKSRFEEGVGTNPEELMAAAHASCYSMKLSFILGAAGFTPDKIETTCAISLENGVITNSHLTVKAIVPGIDEQKFKECAEEAKRECPVSKAYSINKTLEASLD